MILHSAKKSLILLLITLPPSLAHGDSITGGDTVYVVRKGDTPQLVSARTGVSWRQISRDNTIAGEKGLQPGQELKINARRIVPAVIESGIIINVPDRTLYYFEENRLVHSFAVGLGLIGPKSGMVWRTPLGKFKVISKEKNPTWYVPPSIQEEMAMEGKEVKTVVPPGPENPLGRYAIKTTIPGIMIHETIKHSSVNQYRSHGCIRVLPENMEKFFEEVEPRTSGELIYMPVKAAISGEGRVFLEVHKDYYGTITDMKEEAKKQLAKTGSIMRVDWQKVETLLKEKSGIPEDVTL